MNRNFFLFLLFLLGSFMCLYLAFSATVNIPYTTHDSIRYFHKFYNKESESSTYPQYHYEYDLGRPVTAELESLLYRNVSHLSDMSRLRLITIVVFAVSASLLALTAVLNGMEAIAAFCLSVAIFTLPGIQDFIFVPYLTNSLGIFFSLLAYFLATKKLKYAFQFVLALLLLETSFCLYPPSTFFFLVPTALKIIFGHQQQALRKPLLQDLGLWFLSAAFYYLTLHLFFDAQMKASGHQITFTWQRTMIFISTFLTNGLPQTFNLWNVYYSRSLGLVLMGGIGALIVIDFFLTKKWGWKRLAALMSILLVFNLIWFLFGGYVPREFIASQSLALALLCWCGQWLGVFISKDVKIWPILLLCAGLIFANRLTTSNVLNNHSELMFMRSRLAQFVNSSTKEIHIIRLKDLTKGYNGLPTVYDNINGSTNDYEIPDLIRVSLKDMGQPFQLHCMVTYSNYGEPFELMPNGVVIDMNDLAYISSPERK